MKERPIQNSVLMESIRIKKHILESGEYMFDYYYPIQDWRACFKAMKRQNVKNIKVERVAQCNYHKYKMATHKLITAIQKKNEFEKENALLKLRVDIMEAENLRLRTKKGLKYFADFAARKFTNWRLK